MLVCDLPPSLSPSFPPSLPPSLLPLHLPFPFPGVETTSLPSDRMTPCTTSRREGRGGREGGRGTVSLQLFSWDGEDLSSDGTAVEVVATAGQVHDDAIGVAEDGCVA